ncbi:hypothetical protein LTS18_004312 [Coniosporium uncinatum]|uniref:Uncharacterized protein n=1 Tax=Coniosporium uncinatum TaxID=93489 RepID=A0ACC3DYL8_9PEZI|nr:hypothetical protein LTS18_004312 [Coniosporium uncinatum]
MESDMADVVMSVDTQISPSFSPFSPWVVPSISDPPRDDGAIPDNLVRISLNEVHPPIRRLVTVPHHWLARDLHRVIQVALDWTLDLSAESYFIVDDVLPDGQSVTTRVFCNPFSPPLQGTVRPVDAQGRACYDSTELPLEPLLNPNDVRSRRITYHYATYWSHAVELVGDISLFRSTSRVSGNDIKNAVCIGGENHAAAEGLKGAEKWKELQRAFETWTPSKKQKKLMIWYQEQCVNGQMSGLGEGKVGEWDRENVNEKLRFLAQWRWLDDAELKRREFRLRWGRL